MFECPELSTDLFLQHWEFVLLLSETETEIPLPCICFRIGRHSCFQPANWARSVFLITAGKQGEGESRTFTLFHPPGSCSVSSVSLRFIDRPLAPVAEVSLSARTLSERNEKGKDTASAGRDKAQQLPALCARTHTHNTQTHTVWSTDSSSLPHPPLVCLPPPSLSLFSSRYMCSERQLGKQFRARAKGTHTHQQESRTALFIGSSSLGYGTHTLTAAYTHSRRQITSRKVQYSQFFSRLQSRGSHIPR